MATQPRSEGRDKALEHVLQQIDKDMGKGTIMRLGDASKMTVSSFPTGCLALDIALGIGGIPRGRIIELYGPESSGKTSLALHCASEVQKRGGIACLIDAEHALDPDYASRIGVDIANLLVSQPDNGEQALQVCDALVRSGAIDLIIIDSVAALVPKAEIDGDVGDSQIGLQARLMSKALRMLGANMAKSNTSVIFINQLREKIGVYFGSPDITPGGRALKFWASVRIEVRRGEQIKNGTEVIGCRTKVKIVKNKVAPPFKTCEFDMLFGDGISREGCTLDIGVERGVVTRGGARYSFGDIKIGNGRDNSKAFLKENPDIRDAIDNKIREVIVTGVVPNPVVAEEVLEEDA